jgi:hypothetical protein
MFSFKNSFHTAVIQLMFQKGRGAVAGRHVVLNLLGTSRNWVFSTGIILRKIKALFSTALVTGED